MNTAEKLREYFNSVIGEGKRFPTQTELSRFLNLKKTTATKLFSFLKGADTQYSSVVDWLEKLGGQIALPDEELEKYETDDIYIIGGASVYKLMLPHCDTVHVTKIDHSYQADAFFPNLDNMPQWQITGDSDEQTYFDLIYHFYRYEKKKD